ncbi:hypothetical protein [Spiroplasma endosymbiont of Ammophila pubescens]|uniref:hypothetical protein n=1 Tax=Spiroplasma endosymbiont of Ammophila pubescens TaxID=3066315 RepID=UPI0032B2B192
MFLQTLSKKEAKNMKRILQSLMMISIISTSVSSVFACVKKYNFDNSIWVITDGRTVNDLAFNQSAWEGASKYVFAQKNQIVTPQNWKSLNWRASYFESVSQTPGDYKNCLYYILNCRSKNTSFTWFQPW